MKNLFEQTHPIVESKNICQDYYFEASELLENKNEVGGKKINISRASIDDLSGVIVNNMITSFRKILTSFPNLEEE